MAAQAPDGIFYDIHTDTTGRHNDKAFYRDARVNDKMAQLQVNIDGIDYIVYTDKGFDSDSHTEAAHHGLYVTDQQTHSNSVMTCVRVSEEWGFGLVKSRCPLIERKKFMRMNLVPVLRILRVATLLTNVYTCLQGSGTSEYFNCRLPAFETYFYVA